jgi:Xaa-Pro aminopeptidase
MVIDKGKEYLILPPKSHTQDVFDGRTDTEALSERSGIATVLEHKEGWRLLGGKIKRSKHVATLAAAPEYIDSFGLYANPARSVLIRQLKSLNPQLEPLDLRTQLARMRMVKQPIELLAIQSAVDITNDSIKAALSPAKLQRYEFEYELEAEIGRGFRRRGAKGHAFTPIVAGGANACTLHYVANQSAMQAGQLVVVDVGAENEFYAADISRTVALGEPTKRHLQVHAAVLDVQQHAMGLLRPGVLMQTYEQAIEDYMGEKLRELGLIRTIEHDEVRRYYPHATSHFLGLDTHDMGDYAHPLEAGVVLTVEPGIYIPEEGFGIRIEDDVVVTDDGIRELSGRLPRDL